MDGEMHDPMLEIDAMRDIAEALEKLEEAARIRVLRWASERYGMAGLNLKSPKVDTVTRVEVASVSDATEFESAAELLAAAEPGSEAEKALVVGYWFQVIQGQDDIESQEVNTELKHQGHGLSNVTRAFDSLMRMRPQPVIQVRKSGSSKQARKKYRLTTHGIQLVRKLLDGKGGNGDVD